MDATADLEAVLAANVRYYEAFEAADLDAMSAAWEHSDRVTCTHPGWATLRGWARVSSSYFALFQQGATLQFVLSAVHAEVGADTAWVTLDEDLLGDTGGVTVATVNILARGGVGWRLVAHHGSVVHAVEP